jgi:hypothetical protein
MNQGLWEQVEHDETAPDIMEVAINPHENREQRPFRHSAVKQGQKKPKV